MPAPTTTGLARLTVRAPRRRLDVAVPDQVPLAEVLPELLRRAEDGGDLVGPAGGWLVRRADGTALVGENSLYQQGIRDGDVLFLVPRNVVWPEPDYDDLIDEIAAHARRHGRAWGPGATRLVGLGAAGLVLAAVLAVLVASGGPQWTAAGGVAVALAVLLLGTGTLLSRAFGEPVAGAAAAGFALPYAAVGGLVVLARDGTGPAQVLVGSAALLLASALGAIGAGHGLRVFTAGAVVGGAGVLAALVGVVGTAAGAAAVVSVAVVAGIGLAPGLAVRAGRLPLPVISAAPEALAGEPRPDRPRILSAVIRADEVLAGLLLGVSLTATLCVAVLATTGGGTGQLMAACTAAALLLRARPLPTVAARLPLLLGGLVAAVTVAWAVAVSGGPATRVVVVGAALLTVAAALGLAATAHRRRERSPYLTRLADAVDLIAVVALPPIACAVLGLYGFVRAWTS